MGYVGFEVAGGCDSAAWEGGLVWAKVQKPSHRSLVLPRKVQASGFWVEGTIMGWGMWGLRWQGDVIQQHVKGVWFGQKV